MPRQKPTQETVKNAFLNIRISEHQKDVISRAAAMQKTSVSDFVVQNAYEIASQVLAEDTQFVLSPEKWAEFCDALDSRPKTIPALKALLKKPSVFHEH